MARRAEKKKKDEPISIAKVILKRREALNMKEAYLGLAFRAFAVALLGVLIFTQLLTVTIANGMGMFPSVKDGDLVIASRLHGKLEQNDVVIYTAGSADQIGRVVGKAYDLVYMDDSGSLLVNGASQTGEILYPTYPRDGSEYEVKLGPDEVFVLGDYRTKAKDSRDYGPIQTGDVKGKVVTIIRRRGL